MTHLDEWVTQRSLTFPADAPDAVTVGAVNVNSPYSLEPYSSRGPTFGSGGTCSGGSINPDIAGYANVSTVSYGSGAFNGTSAATPHVGGAAALVLGANPSYNVSQLQSYLENNAVDLGTSGKDNLYGAGRLRLGNSPPLPPPQVNSITPNSGANNGVISITNLAGVNFKVGTTVRLTRAGQANINATNVVVVSATKITCNFNLTGAANGQWNVMVTNPDGQSGTLSNGFEVVPGPIAEDYFIYLPIILK
jgi:subtilisin family serine protease